jgi:hypothetical protein
MREQAKGGSHCVGRTRWHSRAVVGHGSLVVRPGRRKGSMAPTGAIGYWSDPKDSVARQVDSCRIFLSRSLLVLKKFSFLFSIGRAVTTKHSRIRSEQQERRGRGKPGTGWDELIFHPDLQRMTSRAIPPGKARQLHAHPFPFPQESETRPFITWRCTEDQEACQRLTILLLPFITIYNESRTTE